MNFLDVGVFCVTAYPPQVMKRRRCVGSARGRSSLGRETKTRRSNSNNINNSSSSWKLLRVDKEQLAMRQRKSSKRILLNKRRPPFPKELMITVC